MQTVVCLSLMYVRQHGMTTILIFRLITCNDTQTLNVTRGIFNEFYLSRCVCCDPVNIFSVFVFLIWVQQNY